MKNQRRIHSILKVFLWILFGVIIGSGVYGCKKQEPAREDTTSKAPVNEPEAVVQAEANAAELNQALFAAVGNGLGDEVVRLISQTHRNVMDLFCLK